MFSAARTVRLPRSVASIRGLRTSVHLERAEVVSHSASLSDRVKSRIAQIDQEQPVSPALIDTFNRRHNYLRISLTERCNLRCFYCMPSEGIELSPKEHILTDDEIIRLATLFVKSGVTKIRLTGGEPTVRKGLVELVGRLHDLRQYGLQSIGMTTNGIALERRIPALVENGLSHLNISLDTLDRFKFEIMTRRMGHEAVMRALDVALASDLRSVKLNVVVVKGLNDHEVLDFLEMTRNKALSIRFIEFMPFTGNKWDKAKMVPSSELLSRITAKHPLVQKAPDELNDTARSYSLPGFKGSFGFISSMSDHFCSSCNRLRLTADGQIKVCLFDAKEISLRDQLRIGKTDDELLHTISHAVRGKREKHAGMEDIDVVTNRPMILIGGTRLADRISIRNRSRQGSQHPHTITLPAVSERRRLFSTTPTVHADAPQTPRLTHIDDSGRPSMVDVSPKDPSKRTAVALGRIYIPRVAYELITTPGDSGPGAYDSAADAPTELDIAKAKARSKGDVLTVAQLAGIMACKRTSELIPLCHPLQLSHISVTLHPQVEDASTLARARELDANAAQAQPQAQYSVLCRAEVTCEGKTGVEMEALTAVSVGLLTVWDMLKAVAGREMIIGEIFVSKKAGGKSGDFMR